MTAVNRSKVISNVCGVTFSLLPKWTCLLLSPYLGFRVPAQGLGQGTLICTVSSSKTGRIIHCQSCCWTWCPWVWSEFTWATGNCVKICPPPADIPVQINGLRNTDEIRLKDNWLCQLKSMWMEYSYAPYSHYIIPCPAIIPYAVWQSVMQATVLVTRLNNHRHATIKAWRICLGGDMSI